MTLLSFAESRLLLIPKWCDVFLYHRFKTGLELRPAVPSEPPRSKTFAVQIVSINALAGQVNFTGVSSTNSSCVAVKGRSTIDEISFRCKTRRSYEQATLTNLLCISS